MSVCACVSVIFCSWPAVACVHEHLCVFVVGMQSYAIWQCSTKVLFYVASDLAHAGASMCVCECAHVHLASQCCVLHG